MRVQLVDQLEAGVARQALDALHAAGVQVERGAAALGVADDQRLQGLRHLGTLLSAQRRHLARALAALVDMGRPQWQQSPALGLGQVVKGRPHIDELGIAAHRRQRHRQQHRGLGRRGKIGVVGVEVLAAHMQLAIHQRQVAAGDGAHLGMVGQRKFFQLLRHQVAEQARGLRKLGRLQLLVADHQHCVPDPGLVQGRLGGRRQRLGQVDAADFGAQRGVHGRDLQGHGAETLFGWPGPGGETAAMHSSKAPAAPPIT